ncbi:MAG: LysM peptidoglycan-binding domain-containing protein [Kiritimatiellales bacterium]|nr:LysM peptidoglycan-binding domain-containing protein [Kiritimatiellota bacterium]MBL7012729.1 LysM peptidoglycan-binding domain-containing protein [Kiritimatiellales bacterium]
MSKKIKLGKLFSLLLAIILIAGCDDARRDNAEEKNPSIRKGLEQAQLKQWNEAIRHFETALSENAELARPDLELALIYQQQKKDYVRAIYHYERYLKKRPDSQKAELIADWIRQAEISFAAEIGQSAGDISEEIIRLTRENNLLRKQLSRIAVAAPSVTSVRTILTEPPPSAAQRAMEGEPKQEPRPPAVSSEPTPVSAEPIARIQTPAPIPETYKVLPGDTLTRIAKTVYGDSSKWKEIYGANLDKMESENDLKAGQIITIP